MGRKSYSGCSWTVPCNPGLAALCNATVNVYAPPCGIGASWCGVPPCGLPPFSPCTPCAPCSPIPPCLPFSSYFPFPSFASSCYSMRSQYCPIDHESCETEFVGLSNIPLSIETTDPLGERKYTIFFTEVRDTNDNFVNNSLFVSNFTGCYKIVVSVPISVDSMVTDPTSAYISLNVNGIPLYNTPSLNDMIQGNIYTIDLEEIIFINKGDIVSIVLNLGEEYTYIISPGNSARFFSGICAPNDCCDC